MILMIDNYDSFTYNLVQYLGELGAELVVRRNDEISLDEVGALRPAGVVLSPGPCTPNEAGICVPLVKRFAGEFPILGVCLGHQSIGAALGGEIIRAKTLMHGKSSKINHDNQGIFKDIPNPFSAIRYHSLVIKRETCPLELQITAESEDGEIMGVRHKSLPIEGVQFHPESVMTENGKCLLNNWLASLSG
jgi:anthranilate synthase component 2